METAGPATGHGSHRFADPKDPPREMSGLAWGVFVTLGLVALVGLIRIVVDLGLNSAASDGGDVVSAYDTYSTWIGIHGLLFLVSAGVFIAWFFRAYKNLRRLGVQNMRYGDGWAIGSWFIPIFNWFRPKQMADDVWRGSERGVEVATQWRLVPVPSLVHWWWGLFLLQGLLIQIGQQVTESGYNELFEFGGSIDTGLSRIETGTMIDLLGAVAGIAAAVLAIMVVSRISNRLDEIRSDVLAVGPSEAPTTPPPPAPYPPPPTPTPTPTPETVRITPITSSAPPPGFPTPTAAPPPPPPTEQRIRCPECAEWIQPQANVCRFCGHRLRPNDAADRPLRLVLGDDLARSRGTVFFRAVFALPFMIWLVVWGVAAACVAFVNWVATLFEAESPAPLHDFLARFVRYSTQAYAYLNLAAEPLPAFDGKRGYPVDVAIEPPSRQSRWSIAFRLVLALPALLLLAVLAGSGSFAYDALRPGGFGLFTALGLAAVFAWFYAMARGRMARGLRDLIAYALSYAAQTWGYLLLLTDRYPSSDPLTAIGPLPTRSDPVRMEVGDALRRSRLTVFFRLALAFPHLVWLFLWGVLALLAAVVNWIATLVAGVSPPWLHRFLGRYVRYQMQVGAFLYLVGNPFPGFVGAAGKYPIELHVFERERQNRWSVAFRLLLAFPALLLTSLFSQVLLVVAVLGWFVAMFTGRMPLGLRNLGAYALRYTAQTYAYVLLVTGAYPYSGPCLELPPAPVPQAAAPFPPAPQPAV